MKWENGEEEREGEKTRKVVEIQTLARESGSQDCVRREGDYTSGVPRELLIAIQR